MKEFSRNAVMERKMLTAEKAIDRFCCNPAIKEGEHSNTWYASVCVPPSVEFVVEIKVQLLERFSSFGYGFWNYWENGIILLHSNHLAMKQLNLIFLYIIHAKNFLNTSYLFLIGWTNGQSRQLDNNTYTPFLEFRGCAWHQLSPQTHLVSIWSINFTQERILNKSW